MPLPLVAIGVDGVVADFASAFDEWAKEITGCNPPPHDHWKWWESYPNHAWLWDTFWREDRKHAIRALRDVAPFEGAVKDVADLNGQCRVAFITGRPDYCFELTSAWLHAQGFVFDHLIARKDRFWENFDLLVDDGHLNVRASVVRLKRGILYRQPWNAEIIDLPAISSLAEIGPNL